MAISKKPSRKTASTKQAAVPVTPDRQAIEGFLAAIAGGIDDDALSKAQDVMYDAWERTTTRSRIALARKALAISPLCADAYDVAGTANKGADLDGDFKKAFPQDRLDEASGGPGHA